MRMALSGDYITPFVEPSVPFLAKPPLSFWITAVSFKIFGFNEFAARLPHFLASLAILIISFCSFKNTYSARFAATVSIVFASTLSFIFLSGSVMTEGSLIFCTSLSIISFWMLLEKNGSKLWNYPFFIAFGLAMLAKGPVGIVLTATPMVIYLTIYRKWADFFGKFWIIRGTLMFVAICAPWYTMMQIRNPDFLEYFIVGEHIKRFLVSGWSGDVYGFSHDQPFGMIWMFFIASTIPWIFFAIFYCTKNIKNTKSMLHAANKENTFFLLCLMIPLLFFTFASNIIMPYSFFSAFPFAFLVAKLITSQKLSNRTICCTSFVSSFIMLGAIYYCARNGTELSDKNYIKTALNNGSDKIYYSDASIQYSSRFYAQDKLEQISRETALTLPRNSYIISKNPLSQNPLFEQIICNHKKTRCLYKKI